MLPSFRGGGGALAEVVGVVAMCWLVRREGKRSEEKRRAPECLVTGLGRSSAPGLRHGSARSSLHGHPRGGSRPILMPPDLPLNLINLNTICPSATSSSIGGRSRSRQPRRLHSLLLPRKHKPPTTFHNGSSRYDEEGRRHRHVRYPRLQGRRPRRRRRHWPGAHTVRTAHARARVMRARRGESERMQKLPSLLRLPAPRGDPSFLPSPPSAH